MSRRRRPIQFQEHPAWFLELARYLSRAGYHRPHRTAIEEVRETNRQRREGGRYDPLAGQQAERRARAIQLTK